MDEPAFPARSDLRFNPSNRLRRSPLFDRLESAGCSAWSIYNRTLIPQWFEGLEADCAHLRRAVQLWDVGGERVVEVAGPDALRLVQMATPRYLGELAPDRCAYIPAVDAEGGMLNDPVLTRIGENRYWLALADGDLGQFLKGLAAGARLNVRVFEPDVWILAIQGPRSGELAGRIWSDAPALGFFRWMHVPLLGRRMVLARTGFSATRGYELYVEGSADLPEIWDRLMEAGQDLDVRAGCPNLIERIEAGLLSYGNDMTVEHTPFEAGLGAFCQLDFVTEAVCHAALVNRQEPVRQIRPVEVSGEKVPPVATLWDVTDREGRPVGKLSSAAWSPERKTNVGIAMIAREHWAPGTRLVVHAPDGERAMSVRERFWSRS